MSTLANRLDSFPEAWKPQPGEKLIGKLVDLDLRNSEYGPPYPILTVLDEAGHEWAWHAFHTMARNEVAKRRPQIGEQVGISYHGKGTAAPGMNAPERWRLLVDRPRELQPPIDWEAVAPDATQADDTTSATAPAADDEIPF